MWWRPASWSPPATSEHDDSGNGGPHPGDPRSFPPGPPSIGFGGWAVGGRGWGPSGSEAERVSTVRAAFDRGIRLFDTAPTYGDSEAVIGRALEGHRDEVMLATKVGPNDDPAVSLDASLLRLRSDRVDLLQLHEASEHFEGSLEAMVRLKDEGKALHLGVSNLTPSQIGRAVHVIGIETYQGPYNLFDREAEQRVLPLCAERGLGFLAYRSLASGLLSGAFGPAPPSFAEGDHRAGLYWFKGREYERRQAVVAQLQHLAERWRMSLPALALAWVLARPGVAVALAGARVPAQVDQNVGAAEHPLGPEEIDEIDSIVAAAFRPPAATAQTRELAAGWGPRERFIVERLDGMTTYEAVAAEWSDREGPALTSAQVKVFADQLVDRGLAVPEAAGLGAR